MPESFLFTLQVVAWWEFIAVAAFLLARLSGMGRRVNTFTFFLPLLLLL